MDKIPAFLKRVNNSLLYNEEGELLFYIPEDYFSDSKNPFAQIVGENIITIGIMGWALAKANGAVDTNKVNVFMYPTYISCKPSNIEKIKSLVLNKTSPKDYRVLHFKKGDEVISDCYTAQDVDNTMFTLNMTFINGNKMPTIMRYDKMHEILPLSLNLNGNDFGMNMQFYGLLCSESFRNPKDLSEPYRFTNMNEDTTNYRQLSIDDIPKYISPYVALTSNNFDESLMAAMIMSNDVDNIKYSPLEKVIMM